MGARMKPRIQTTVALIASVLTTTSAISQTPPCDLSPITSRSVYGGTIPSFAGAAPLNYTVSIGWQFSQRGNRFIDIVETLKIAVPDLNQRLLDAVMSNAGQLPHDDCNDMVIIDRKETRTENGRLIADIGYKVQKWACVGSNYPCPDYTNLFSPQGRGKTCRVDSKNIIGEGAGYLRVNLTPRYATDGVIIDLSKDADFHLSSGSVIGTALVSAVLLGPSFAGLGPIAGRAFESSFKSLPFNYPPIEVPTDIATGKKQFKLTWLPRSAYFATGSILFGANRPPLWYPAIETGTTLVRERVTSQRPALSCIVHHALQAL